jgi:hypothetical protein
VAFATSGLSLHPDTPFDFTGDQQAIFSPAKIETPVAIGMKDKLAQGFGQSGQPDLLQQYSVPIDPGRPNLAPSRGWPGFHLLIVARMFYLSNDHILARRGKPITQSGLIGVIVARLSQRGTSRNPA